MNSDGLVGSQMVLYSPYDFVCSCIVLQSHVWFLGCVKFPNSFRNVSASDFSDREYNKDH